MPSPSCPPRSFPRCRWSSTRRCGCRGKAIRPCSSKGTVVSFEEVNRPWLPRAEWSHRKVDVDGLALSDHPIVAGLTPEDVRWHAHGVFRPYPEADVLIADGNGDAVLYLDERSFTGRILAGTLDPDCHAGYGSGRTRPLLRRLIAAVREAATPPSGPSPVGQRSDRQR
jgi:hypothetical protein